MNEQRLYRRNEIIIRESKKEVQDKLNKIFSKKGGGWKIVPKYMESIYDLRNHFYHYNDCI